MAETADTINITVSPPQPESSESSKEEVRSDSTSEIEKKPLGGILYSVWPPSQKSRDSLMNALIEILSTESFFTPKYGTFKSEEASVIVKSIEEEAYVAASKVVSSVADGIKNLETYNDLITERLFKYADDRLFKANVTSKSTYGT